MTTVYVSFAISILANCYATYLLIRSAQKYFEMQTHISRLEEICRRRALQLGELEELVKEALEEDDHEYSRDSAAYSNPTHVHKADEDPVRSQDQELHRTKPSPIY